MDGQGIMEKENKTFDKERSENIDTLYIHNNNNNIIIIIISINSLQNIMIISANIDND